MMTRTTKAQAPGVPVRLRVGPVTLDGDEEVARLAAAWLTRYLGRRGADRAEGGPG